MPKPSRPDDGRFRKQVPGRIRGRKAITEPSPKAHWICHFVFLHLRLENMTLTSFLKEAGFDRHSYDRWWKGLLSPRISEVEACLGVFGYELKATPKPKPKGS